MDNLGRLSLLKVFAAVELAIRKDRRANHAVLALWLPSSFLPIACWG